MSKTSRRLVARRIVELVESGSMSSKQAARMLAAYLVDERRTGEAHLMINDLNHELEQRGRTTVNVSSAHQLDAQLEKELKDLFKQKTGAHSVELLSEIDQSLLGGLKARSADLEIDLSVQGKLNALKAQS